MTSSAFASTRSPARTPPLKLAERPIGKEMITEVDQDIQRWRPKTSAPARTSKGAKAVGEYCSKSTQIVHRKFTVAAFKRDPLSQVLVYIAQQQQARKTGYYAML